MQPYNEDYNFFGKGVTISTNQKGKSWKKLLRLTFIPLRYCYVKRVLCAIVMQRVLATFKAYF